jgi:small subunit ribosomal protein S14
MAKKSSIEKNNKRRRMSKSGAAKRARLKAIVMDKETSIEEKVAAQFAMQKMPRDTSRIRIRNRCELTGRPRGNYRKFGLCRLKMRDLASTGYLPGVVKSSW